MTQESRRERGTPAPAVPGIDVPAATQRAVDLLGDVAARGANLAREATYVTVGLTILSCQRAQVRRREIERFFRP